VQTHHDNMKALQPHADQYDQRITHSQKVLVRNFFIRATVG